MSEFTDEQIVAAAKLIVLARLGDKYELVGTGVGEDVDVIEVDVREKDKPRNKAETICVLMTEIEKVISQNLDIEHLQGKKPMPEEVRKKVREDYGDGYDAFFEGRE